VFAGWAHGWRTVTTAGPLLAHSVDVGLHVSPGDIGADNGDDELTAFTLGRATSAQYAYLTASYDLDTRLTNGRRVSVGVNGQFASDALPDTEQLSIGGLDAVRGYASEDGAYDSGVILRSEFGLMAEPFEQGILRARPFLFLDAGYGHDIGRDVTDEFASIGIGASMSIGAGGSADAVIGLPMIDGPANEAWEPRVQVTFNYRF
jgi:hemolysin activation/secretion protein